MCLFYGILLCLGEKNALELDNQSVCYIRCRHEAYYYNCQSYDMKEKITSFWLAESRPVCHQYLIGAMSNHMNAQAIEDLCYLWYLNFPLNFTCHYAAGN